MIQRVIRIFEAFEVNEPALTVSQIALRAGLHIATASRLVDQLAAQGLLQRDGNRGVRIGMRFWELASRAAPTRGLRETALPFMEDLHAVVGHHAQLGVLDGFEVLFVERLTAPGSVISFTHVAGRLPLHASSCGLVLLAHAPAQLQERAMVGPYVAYTSHTITDAAALRRTLAEVRRQGFALCAGHIHPEATGIAVPVRDSRGQVVAALSVVVPNDTAARSRIAVLQASARGIGRALTAAPSAARPGRFSH